MNDNHINQPEKEKWNTPILIILKIRETQSGDEVAQDNEDDSYSYSVE